MGSLNGNEPLTHPAEFTPCKRVEAFVKTIALGLQGHDNHKCFGQLKTFETAKTMLCEKRIFSGN